jgi:D-glycero-D-manno-heptose 1,7-bisphosphate phosphatase
MMAAMNQPAVFLDRDGTVIEDRGYLGAPDQVAFYPGAVRALRRLQADFLLFIVTNQSGIAQKLITAEAAERVNRHVVEELARGGVRIQAVFTCPHDRGECDCRKPSPRFLHEAAVKFGVDLGRSFVVGDHPHDVETARNAGAQGVYVLTGHGEKHRAELAADAPVTADIEAAAEWIAAASRTRGGDSEPVC